MGARGWIIFAVIAALVLGGLIAVSSGNRLDVSEFNADSIITANEKNGQIADHAYGNKDAKVIIVEYGDFQCPGCASANPTVNTIKERYKDQVAFVFRNLPLVQIHPNARAAAAAAEAAGLQGKYWQMNDKLFQNQNEWGQANSSDRLDVFRNYARELAMNIDKFDEDIASEAVEQKVKFDAAIFRATGHPQSTPTFVVNGELIGQDVWGSVESFDAYIKDLLKELDVELPEESEE